MHLRLALLTAIAPLTLAAAPVALPLQEPPAKRLSAIVGVAVDEYAKGVDAKGRLISAVELDEATSFLRDARDVARRLTSPNAGAVRLLLDSLNAAAARRVTPAELARTYLKFVNALGAEGALDLPSGPVDLARGKAIYQRDCVSCHGATGGGDGIAAKNLSPPPAPIGQSVLMRGVTPALMYRIVSVGIQGTTMVGWASKLTPDERWAVVAYVNSRRGRRRSVSSSSL